MSTPSPLSNHLRFVIVLAAAAAACRGNGHASASSHATRQEPAQVASESSPAPLAPSSPPHRVETRSAGQRSWPPTPPAVETDWCIDLVHALDEESCYVLPDVESKELLLYLHGVVPPVTHSVQKTNFETVVANASRRAGVVALIPRGRKGLAGKARNDWWGWPTSAAAHAELTPALVTSFAAKRKRLEELVGYSFERLYLAGSSSGAYYAVALALKGDLDADGYGAMSGGALPWGVELSRVKPRPFYIGYGKHDPVGASARGLSESLRKAGWPVRIAEHPVDHGAREVYLDEAFAFWRDALD